ncbi:MAG: IS5 family transposase [Myxococcales bacterium]|nr:IS5 family transposase [Myxococcales bacterium]
MTDAQWKAIEPIFKEEVGNHGNRAKWNKRILMDAVLYLTKTGCQWRMIPKNFPPYQTVWSFYRRAQKSGLWTRLMNVLIKLDREMRGRKADPSFSLIDSQSVKTTGPAEERGFDGGKKIKGRKRHIVIDLWGNILAVVVHAANLHDTMQGGEIFQKALSESPSLLGVCADAGYRETFENAIKSLGLKVEISERIKHEFEILPYPSILPSPHLSVKRQTSLLRSSLPSGSSKPRASSDIPRPSRCKGPNEGIRP